LYRFVINLIYEASFFAIFLFTLSIQAQFQVGVRRNQSEPLAFTITSVDGSTTISDVDGKFSISSKSMPSFDVSYVGYSKTTVPILKGKAITAFRSCVKEMI
jgi:hypothetical protein